MRFLLYGQLISHALCAVANAGIPDLISSSGPADAETLARRSNLNEGALERTLNALSTYGVFRKFVDGRFSLTDVGRALCRDGAATALPTARLLGGEIGAAWSLYADCLQSGEPSFNTVHRTTFFDYARMHPEFMDSFQMSQASGLELDIAGIIRALPDDCRFLIDVGGGDGALLQETLLQRPEARGLIFELPDMRQRAVARITASGLEHRFRFEAGDFRRDVPDGGDTYILRQILHNWDDETCHMILRNCRRAMEPQARLIVLDITANQCDDHSSSRMSAIMDLYMLTIFSGRERTANELATLLYNAGFAVEGVEVLNGAMSMIVAVPN